MAAAKFNPSATVSSIRLEIAGLRTLVAAGINAKRIEDNGNDFNHVSNRSVPFQQLHEPGLKANQPLWLC